MDLFPRVSKPVAGVAFIVMVCAGVATFDQGSEGNTCDCIYIVFIGNDSVFKLFIWKRLVRVPHTTVVNRHKCTYTHTTAVNRHKCTYPHTTVVNRWYPTA